MSRRTRRCYPFVRENVSETSPEHTNQGGNSLCIARDGAAKAPRCLVSSRLVLFNLSLCHSISEISFSLSLSLFLVVSAFCCLRGPRASALSVFTGTPQTIDQIQGSLLPARSVVRTNLFVAALGEAHSRSFLTVRNFARSSSLLSVLGIARFVLMASVLDRVSSGVVMLFVSFKN